MTYDTIIIGGGVLGCAAAYYLSKKGQSVVVIEQFQLQNNLNSSYDATRILKFAHGDDVLKTKMAVESLAFYKDLEKLSGKQLFFPCPAFFPGKTNEYVSKRLTNVAKHIREKYVGSDANDHHIATVNTLKSLDYTSNLLLQKEIQKKFPQFKCNFGMVDENAGILKASSTIDAFMLLLKQQKVTILEKKKVIKIKNNQIVFEDGGEVKGEKIVVASGAWTRKLLGNQIKMVSLKKELVYISFKKNKINMPIFLDINTGFYGVPIHKGNGIKIGNHYIGEEADPDTVDRTVSKEFIDMTRSYLEKFIPKLADGEIIKTKVCLYEMPQDEEFIIDEFDKNIFVIVGAGQAFKFAPLFGKLMSELVLGEKPSFNISRFRLSRFL